MQMLCIQLKRWSARSKSMGCSRPANYGKFLIEHLQAVMALLLPPYPKQLIRILLGLSVPGSIRKRIGSTLTILPYISAHQYTFFHSTLPNTRIAGRVRNATVLELGVACAKAF